MFLPKLFHGRNFWIKNAREPIKGSKYSDFSLVEPLKTWMKYFPLAVWAQGTMTIAEKT